MRFSASWIHSWGRCHTLVACLAVGACVVLAARAWGEDRVAKPQSAPKHAAQANAGEQAREAARKEGRKEARKEARREAERPAAAKPSRAISASDEKAIRREFQVKGDFDFHETPLSEVIDYLKDRHKIEIQIDQKAFEELGVGTDVPITFHARGISTGSALAMILRQHDLAWVIRDEVVLVTTKDQAESMLETRVYAVYDLVMVTPFHPFDGTYAPGVNKGGFPQPAASFSMGSGASGSGLIGGAAGGMMGGMGGGMFAVTKEPPSTPPASSGATGGAKTATRSGSQMAPSRMPDVILDMDSLIDLITATIQPTSWDEVGGPGSIVPLADMLVISQTAESHQEIENLLAALRAASPGLQPVSIRATWLLLDMNQLDQLLSSKPGTKRGIDPRALAEMAAKTKGYAGAIACLNGQTVHFASGRNCSAVVSAIPVVGSGVGYQPIVSNPQSGAVLQVTPQLLPNSRAAVLDVQSVVTRLEAPPEPTRFLSGQATGPSEDGKDKAAASGEVTVTLDRVKMLVDQLATTVKVPLGEPTLVGGLTQTGGITYGSPTEEQSAASTPQLYLFVEVTAK